MKIVKKYPPNIKQIRKVLNPTKTCCFAYGDTIYNPSGNEIKHDILVHEQTHEHQQKTLGTKEWWDKYLSDKSFRQESEVEAYATQLKWVKEYIPKLYDQFLEVLAQQLSTLYSLDITYHQAFTLIRMKTKELM